MRPPLEHLHLMRANDCRRFACGIPLRQPLTVPFEHPAYLLVYVTCARCKATAAFRAAAVQRALAEVAP